MVAKLFPGGGVVSRVELDTNVDLMMEFLPEHYVCDNKKGIQGHIYDPQ